MINRFLYFQLTRLIGSSTARYYKEFLEVERLSREQLEQLQTKRLRALLEHATREVPFYRDCLVLQSREPGESPSLPLAHFPILDKSDIRSHYTELMVPGLRMQYASGSRTGRGYSWKEVKTGGSTGVPTVVIHDKDFRDRGRASRLYSQHLCGFPLGVRYVRLWGSMKEINEMRDSLSSRVAAVLARDLLLNAFRMSESRMDSYIKRINASGAKHMMAYADAAYQLALYSERSGEWVKPFVSIMACAGTVTTDIRDALARVFRARVHNKYGSRDCTDMACECSEGGLHIYSHHALLEVVDKNGAPVSPGKRGEILVTLLGNHSFPMIRYRIGDVGSLSASNCPCGRPFPLLESLEGRTAEMITATRGDYITPAYVIHLIGVVHNPGFIRRFQLVQESGTNYELKLVIEQGVLADQYDDVVGKIARDLIAVLGSDASLDIVRADDIPATASGKFLYTVNRLRGHSDPRLP